MRLDKKWADKLAALPESGMGYQIIDVILKNGNIIKNITVFDCEIIPNRNLSFSNNDIKDVILHP